MSDTTNLADSPMPEDDSDEMMLEGAADQAGAAAGEGGNGGAGAGENEKQQPEQSEGSNGADNSAPAKKFIDNRFAIFFYERICQGRPPTTKREFAQVYSNFVRSVSASELRAHGKAIAPMQCLWQLTRLGHVKVLRDGELQWVVPRSPSPGTGPTPSDGNNVPVSPSVSFASPLSTVSSPSMSPFPAFSFSPQSLPSPSPRRKLDGGPAPSPRKKDGSTPSTTRPVRGGGQKYAGLHLFLERLLGEQEAEKYTTILVQNEVDWATLHMLGKQELVDLGFSVGARIKIANAITQNLETHGGVPPVPGSREDQQRQIDQLTHQVQSLQVQLAQRSPKPDGTPHSHAPPHSQPPLHPQMSPRPQLPPQMPTTQTLATLNALAGFAVRDVLLALIAAAENAQLSLAALHMQFQGRTGLHLTAAVEALGFSNVVMFLRTVPHVVVLGNAVKLAQPGPFSSRTRLEKSWRRTAEAKEGENSPSDDESDIPSGEPRSSRAPQSASSTASRPSPVASPAGRKYVLQEVG